MSKSLISAFEIERHNNEEDVVNEEEIVNKINMHLLLQQILLE